MGTNGVSEVEALPTMATKTRFRGFLRLRGRDSNPNFLIQSQASYH
jgi:hypothetical protein